MKILMIGAHQDDNEFRCGGLAHRLTKMGHEVRFLSCCNGCGGHHIMTPEETVKRRAEESAAVAVLLGIQYDVWDINDCTLMADSHRPNDYHADHRAVAQLVQDASYMLTVPHECPDVPAMRRMPVIMYNEDRFYNPVFRPDIVLDMDDELETKLQIANLNVSQVYEWLPYTHEEEVPEGEEARFAWLKEKYSARLAKTAARFRTQLMEQYGEVHGEKIHYAEAYEISEYGAPYAGSSVQEMLERAR